MTDNMANATSLWMLRLRCALFLCVRLSHQTYNKKYSLSGTIISSKVLRATRLSFIRGGRQGYSGVPSLAGFTSTYILQYWQRVKYLQHS
jgi:hypothetical protein